MRNYFRSLTSINWNVITNNPSPSKDRVPNFPDFYDFLLCRRTASNVAEDIKNLALISTTFHRKSAVVVGQEKRRKLGWDAEIWRLLDVAFFLPFSCMPKNQLCLLVPSSKKHIKSIHKLFLLIPAFFVPSLPARCLSETSFASPRIRNTCW